MHVSRRIRASLFGFVSNSGEIAVTPSSCAGRAFVIGTRVRAGIVCRIANGRAIVNVREVNGLRRVFGNASAVLEHGCGPMNATSSAFDGDSADRVWVVMADDAGWLVARRGRVATHGLQAWVRGVGEFSLERVSHMARARWGFVGLTALVLGVAGCAHCDTCDDFPVPCSGTGGCDASGPIMTGPTIMVAPGAAVPIQSGTGQVSLAPAAEAPPIVNSTGAAPITPAVRPATGAESPPPPESLPR